MRFIRGRAEGRWLPARHHFAVFRLIAFLRLRRARHENDDVMLAVERHQSTFESLLVGFWIFGTAACYIAASLTSGWWIVPALIVSFLLALMLMQLIFVPTAALLMSILRRVQNTDARDSVDLHSAFHITLLTLVSFRYAFHSGWTRYVAWQFLFCLVVNACAAIAMFLLRHEARALDASFGGVSSAS